MKIGIISTYFYPFRGGVEENTFYLSKELSKDNEVHIFTSDRKNNEIIKLKEEKLNKINIHRSKTLFRYKYYLTFYPSLLINLLKYDLDIIHTNSLGFIWHDICLIIKKIVSPKTKIIITPHGPFMTLKEYPFWQKILKNIVNKWIILTNNVYDSIIEVNPYQSKWLTKEYKFKKEKITYIPNGINKSIFNKTNTQLVLKKYNLTNKFIISYIGRLHKYKGIQDVIKVMPNLLKINKNIIFIVIGQDAGYKEELLKLTKELKLEKNILFLTKSNDEERNTILELSKIYIMPSEWEAFGITILEAMAKGNAIVSTKTEGGKFLIKKENGSLYEFNDTKELEINIKKLIINNKIRKEIQYNNIKKAKEFMWDKIIIKLENEYKKLEK